MTSVALPSSNSTNVLAVPNMNQTTTDGGTCLSTTTVSSNNIADDTSLLISTTSSNPLVQRQVTLDQEIINTANRTSSSSFNNNNNNNSSIRSFPRHCHTHTPTLQELQTHSFSDYVRNVVLPAAHPYTYDDDDVPDFTRETMELSQGIAKVKLPDGFWKEQTIAQDRTGRGPSWSSGTTLGDMNIHSPIQQNIRGMAGVYEYIFTEETPLTVAQFRDKADAYRKAQIGSHEKEENYTTERVMELERFFWKRLGPTMPPAWYGADEEGTLFADDPATGWSVAQLDSCLHVLDKVPGVTTPYVYVGMWGSCFAAHTEDMNLLSINYLHAGAPKIWYAVAPGNDAKRFEALAEHHYALEKRKCREFLRHKRCLLSPVVLQRAGIRYQTAVQMPGEAIITFPAGYHFGFNAGFNLAEATNFGVPEWIPYGLKAGVCLCRPDSVRIDMERLIALLEKFDAAKKRDPSISSWKKWRQLKDEEKLRKKQEQAEKEATRKAQEMAEQQKKPKLSMQQRRKEFWVEVMQPLTKAAKSILLVEEKAEAESHESIVHEEPDNQAEGETDTEETKKSDQSEENTPDDAIHPQKRPRKKKRHFDAIQEEEEERLKKLMAKTKKSMKKPEPKIDPEPMDGIWHLAKPINKKADIQMGTRVLCMLPGTTMDKFLSTRASFDEDEEDEQCFAGYVAEIMDVHVRVRLDGLSKAEDVWMQIDGPKLYLDGGRWNEECEEEGIPKLHYWQIMDSKERCAK